MPINESQDLGQEPKVNVCMFRKSDSKFMLFLVVFYYYVALLVIFNYFLMLHKIICGDFYKMKKLFDQLTISNLLLPTSESFEH